MSLIGYIFFFVFLSTFLICHTEADEHWLVGFNAQSISPSASQGKVCLGGYGACTCRAQTGVHDDLFARAMFLRLSSSPSEAALFVSLDVVGMSNRFIRAAVSQIAQALSIEPARIVLSSTHSHSTPDLAGIWGGVSSEYRAFVLARVLAAATAAHAAAVPAVLRASSASFSLAGNRRGWDATDPAVLVLWAVAQRDAHARAGEEEGQEEEEILAILVNYAAHPVFIGSDNTLAARDWPDGLISTLEASLQGGPAMFVNGAQGDVSPSRAVGGSTPFEQAFQYGALLAQTALAAMGDAGATSVVEPALHWVRQGFSQCVINQQFLLALNAGCMDYDFYADSSCPRNGLLPSKKVDSQVVYFRLGTQLQVAVLPGEATTRMAVDGVGAPGFVPSADSIKSVMRAPIQAVFGLSTDFLGYFIPTDEWNSPVSGKTPANKDYEEGVSLGGPDANIWLRDRVKALIVEDEFELPLPTPSQPDYLPSWWN